ncbi:MAG: hypothetical protein FK734_07625 [Asgard group archaeon]|nr:hypothetical protein [Asgard group archaeon]
MKELYLNCDSRCVSCPVYDRIIKVSNFSQRNLPGAYYCPHCDIYSLCRLGLAYRRGNDNKLYPVCTKCGRYMNKIELSYEKGRNEKPFNSNSFLFIRKPNGQKYDILKTIRGSYFKDLAEVLLYVLYALGPDNYDIIDYNTLTRKYKMIFDGTLNVEDISITYY